MADKPMWDTKKQNRIERLRNDFEAGNITTWDQVFDLYAKTTIAADLGIHFTSFTNKVKNPIKFTLEEILALATLLKLDYRIILKFIINLTPKSKRPVQDKAPII